MIELAHPGRGTLFPDRRRGAKMIRAQKRNASAENCYVADLTLSLAAAAVMGFETTRSRDAERVLDT